MIEIVTWLGSESIQYYRKQDKPLLVMDSDGFLRHVLFRPEDTHALNFCHQPVIVEDRSQPLGDVIVQLHFDPQTTDDNVITHDVILLWGENPKVITGADLLVRLMRGIIRHSRQTDAVLVVIS